MHRRRWRVRQDAFQGIYEIAVVPGVALVVGGVATGYLREAFVGRGADTGLRVTIDHRVLDGTTGAKLLAEIRRMLEEPALMLA
mgnify:CR=1 FL=1